MTVAAVLFDLDGTLLDHRRSAVEGLRSWLDSFGRPLTADLEAAWFIAEAEHYQCWLDGLISHEEQRRRRLRDFLPLLGLAVGPDAELDDLYTGGFLAAYESAWCGFADLDIVPACRTADLRTGVLTNGSVRQQNAKTRALGLAGCLDVVVTSEELGWAKPDPRAFRMACQRLGTAPEQTVYVGDNHEVDVLGARSAGLRAVHVDRLGAGPSQESQQIATLADLWRHLLIERPPHPSVDDPGQPNNGLTG